MLYLGPVVIVCISKKKWPLFYFVRHFSKYYRAKTPKIVYCRGWANSGDIAMDQKCWNSILMLHMNQLRNCKSNTIFLHQIWHLIEMFSPFQQDSESTEYGLTSMEVLLYFMGINSWRKKKLQTKEAGLNRVICMFRPGYHKSSQYIFWLYFSPGHWHSVSSICEYHWVLWW